MSTVVLRRLREGDAPAVKALETESGLSPWSVADYRAEASREESVSLVAEAGSEIRGFLISRLITNENLNVDIEILNIAVSRGFQRSGIAESLFSALLSEIGKIAGAFRIFLEVRESNSAALQFYRKMGFRVSGKRPGFYRDPVEDAVLMAFDSKIAVS